MIERHPTTSCPRAARTAVTAAGRFVDLTVSTRTSERRVLRCSTEARMIQRGYPPCLRRTESEIFSGVGRRERRGREDVAQQ